MFTKTLSLAAGLALLTGSLLAADTYTFDKAHTEVGFKIVHWSVSKVHGGFDDFDGTVTYDVKEPAKLAVDVTIKAESIDTRNGMRDKHLKSPDFFDVAKFPNLTFKSTAVAVSADAKTLDITGDLTIRDVTKSVVLHTTLTAPMEDAFGKTRVGFEGSTTVNRKDYGIAWNKANKTGTMMLADEVEITVSGEAVKK